MTGRKQGEQEAIAILENIGIQVDRDYSDDNSHQRMPDIRCKDGRFIEVTHTRHNNDIPKSGNRFDLPQSGEDWDACYKRRQTRALECGQALERYGNSIYEKDEQGKLSAAGQKQLKKDEKLIKDHLGYDVKEKDFTKQFSEFKCDHPAIIHSTDNILREITEDKGEKYPDGNVDLFIFVTEQEFQLMKNLIAEKIRNVNARGFLSQIFSSPFPRVYICAWCFEKQEYNTVDPKLVIFSKSTGFLQETWVEGQIS